MFSTFDILTGAQKTCTRNMHRIERSSVRCKFLVTETFKHSRPIKPHDFGHMHRWQFLVKVSCLCVTPIMQVSGIRFLNVCHRYYWPYNFYIYDAWCTKRNPGMEIPDKRQKAAYRRTQKITALKLHPSVTRWTKNKSHNCCHNCTKSRHSCLPERFQSHAQQ